MCWPGTYVTANMVFIGMFGRRLSKLEMLKRRGKGPPKKGQGKKAAKRNKVSTPEAKGKK